MATCNPLELCHRHLADSPSAIAAYHGAFTLMRLPLPFDLECIRWHNVRGRRAPSRFRQALLRVGILRQAVLLSPCLEGVGRGDKQSES